MEIRDLYDFARQQNIEVIPFPLAETGSMSLMDETGSCYIGMDLGNVLGPAIGAFVISDFGYGPLFYAYAVVLLLCIPIYYLYTRKTKEKVSQS